MINNSKKMLVVQTEEKADSYIYYDEYKSMNPTDIGVLSIEEAKKFKFSNGSHPVEPSVGKTYIQNLFNPQEYIEMTSNFLKRFEKRRLNKYFELAHLLGATKIEYARKNEEKEKSTRSYNAKVQGFMEKNELTVSSLSFSKKYDKLEQYGKEQYNRAKRFIEVNHLIHDDDFTALLSDRDPSGSLLQNSVYTYTYRKEVSSIFNLALNFDNLAKVLKMENTPLSFLIPSDVDTKLAREAMISQEVALEICFDGFVE